METDTTKRIASILPQIVGPQGQLKASPTTAKPPSAKQQEWLRNRLKLNYHHPRLESAIPELTRFVLALHEPKVRCGITVLFGSNGCGKSHIAKRIKEIFENNRLTIGPTSVAATSETEADCKIVECVFVHWPTAIDEIKKDQWHIFERCCVEYFVILDDIGAEHDPSGIGLEKLYLILNQRENKPTLVTTNFPPAQWKSKFEPRIASRLFRNSTHIDLSGVPDYSTL